MFHEFPKMIFPGGDAPDGKWVIVNDADEEAQAMAKAEKPKSAEIEVNETASTDEGKKKK